MTMNVGQLVLIDTGTARLCILINRHSFKLNKTNNDLVNNYKPIVNNFYGCLFKIYLI